MSKENAQEKKAQVAEVAPERTIEEQMALYKENIGLKVKTRKGEGRIQAVNLDKRTNTFMYVIASEIGAFRVVPSAAELSDPDDIAIAIRSQKLARSTSEAPLAKKARLEAKLKKAQEEVARLTQELAALQA